MRKLTIHQFVNEISTLDVYCVVDGNNVHLLPDKPTSLEHLDNVEVEGMNLSLVGTRSGNQLKLPKRFKCESLNISTTRLVLPEQLMVKNLEVACDVLVKWPENLVELDNLRLKALLAHCELPEGLTVKHFVELGGNNLSMPKGFKCGKLDMTRADEVVFYPDVMVDEIVFYTRDPETGKLIKPETVTWDCDAVIILQHFTQGDKIVVEDLPYPDDLSDVPQLHLTRTPEVGRMLSTVWMDLVKKRSKSLARNGRVGAKGLVHPKETMADGQLCLERERYSNINREAVEKMLTDNKDSHYTNKVVISYRDPDVTTLCSTGLSPTELDFNEDRHSGKDQDSD